LIKVGDTVAYHQADIDRYGRVVAEIYKLVRLINRPLAKVRKTVILSVNEESPGYFATLCFAQYDKTI